MSRLRVDKEQTLRHVRVPSVTRTQESLQPYSILGAQYAQNARGLAISIQVPCGICKHYSTLGAQYAQNTRGVAISIQVPCGICKHYSTLGAPRPQSAGLSACLVIRGWAPSKQSTPLEGFFFIYAPPRRQERRLIKSRS